MNLNVAWPPPGRYIIAVSGGADSMTLLHLLAQAAAARRYQLVVAHFDHGLRPDSAADCHLVRTAATRYRLPFEYHEAQLGVASEAAARAARYAWLEQVRARHRPAAIITAHHQDDLLETSLLNLARGSGRRGLAPMQTGPILRPLLAVARADLHAYAVAHQLAWHEDSTNADTTNPRNFLRHTLLLHAAPEWRAQYLSQIRRLATLNHTIGGQLDRLLSAARISSSEYRFSRPTIRDLSLLEAEELLVATTRCLDPDAELDRRAVQEIALFAKTARPGRRRPLRQNLQIVVDSAHIRVYYMGISSGRPGGAEKPVEH